MEAAILAHMRRVGRPRVRAGGRSSPTFRSMSCSFGRRSLRGRTRAFIPLRRRQRRTATLALRTKLFSQSPHGQDSSSSSGPNNSWSASVKPGMAVRVSA
jgi:hypothetical protein